MIDRFWTPLCGAIGTLFGLLLAFVDGRLAEPVGATSIGAR